MAGDAAKDCEVVLGRLNKIVELAPATIREFHLESESEFRAPPIRSISLHACRKANIVTGPWWARRSLVDD